MTTHTLTLDIPRPLLTTNESRSRHWRVSYRAKNETEMLVRSALRTTNVPPQTTPVDVVVTWFAPDRRRRDSDALEAGELRRKGAVESKRGRERANAHRPLTHSLEQARRG